MREILFRGKKKNDSKWIYGNLIKLNEKYYIQPQSKLMWQKLIMGELVVYEVEPKTVGQYTGFIDKNHKKIFEGDEIMSSNNRIWVVESEIFGYVLREAGFFEYTTFSDIEISDVVIVGNIVDPDADFLAPFKG